ncbi:hypothetical protein D3C78_1838960 [compost metagenome]
MGGNHAVDDALHQLGYLFPHLRIMGAQGARQPGAVRDHVVALPGLESGDG